MTELERSVIQRTRSLFDLRSEMHASRGGTYDGDLYELARQAREISPVHRGSVRTVLGLPPSGNAGVISGEPPVYSLFDWETVSTALRDNGTFSSRSYEKDHVPVFGRSLLALEGEAHRRYRSLVQPAFGRKHMPWWIGHGIAPIASDLVATLSRKPKADLNLEFCAQLPMRLMMQAFGISEADALTVRESVERMQVPGDPGAAGRDRLVAAKEAEDALLPVISDRRKRPQDDLISVLVAAKLDDGETLNDGEIVMFARLLLAAGTGTVWRQLAITLYRLLTHPAEFAAVRDDRSLIPSLLEESIRWQPTPPVFRRLVARDTLIGGAQMRAGTIVELFYGAANRDPKRWSDPDEFQLQRPVQLSAGFGGGPHFCLGAHLARAEMSTALGIIFDRLPALRLDPDCEPPRLVGVEQRGPTALPVVW